MVVVGKIAPGSITAAKRPQQKQDSPYIKALKELYFNEAYVTRAEARKSLGLTDGRLDFWNYPDWSKAGNVRDGGQPFWMFDPVDQPPEPPPAQPKPTHRKVVKRVGNASITVMEKIVD